jgi:hypothetical protein
MGKETLISEVETWVGAKLPAQYRQFLLAHEESIFADNVLLYPAEYLIERNKTYETKTYCPAYLAIGDDSGGRAFVIQLGVDQSTIYIVDQGDMSPDSFEIVGNNFSEWVWNGCSTGGENA